MDMDDIYNDLLSIGFEKYYEYILQDDISRITYRYDRSNCTYLMHVIFKYSDHIEKITKIDLLIYHHESHIKVETYSTDIYIKSLSDNYTNIFQKELRNRVISNIIDGIEKQS